MWSPRVAPETIALNLETALLTAAGPLTSDLAGADEQVNLHVNERFAGRFRKVVSLPDDIDPDGVSAECRDGVLHISVRRRQEMQPRRIDVH